MTMTLVMLTGLAILASASSLKGQSAPTDQRLTAAMCGGSRPQSIVDGVQVQVPCPNDVIAMEDAIPTQAAATPLKPRRLLVLCKAAGFVHSSIPLAAATVKAMGDRTGAYATTITYDPADINAANLAQYDAIVLDSTTGSFLDDPQDAAATSARRAALLAFVRNGKGLAGIHAASDAYQTPSGTAGAPIGVWPEFNRMIGAWFKWHWSYPQQITVKIDDPASPITRAFHAAEFTVHDETYTFAQDSFSRRNVHVLMSLDYTKMSGADKAREQFPRTDHDYALSWIRREGKGRVFYQALGHSEHIYAVTPILQEVLAGIQYALGDLQADDRPDVR